MTTNYKIPTQISIDHVHPKVSNLQQSLEFYFDLLGFEITTMHETDVAFLSAGVKELE
jgi:catechol 2,3-dioxygenase